jgi:hypothetical protein
MSDDVSEYADHLRACLDGGDPDQALIAMSAEPARLSRLPRSGNNLHPLVGVAAMLMAGALIRCGRAGDARPFIGDVADLFAPEHRYYVRGSNLADLTSCFPYLWFPGIIASIAVRDYEGAVTAILNLADWIRHEERWTLAAHPVVTALLEHPRIGVYGPFGIERHWLLDRQEEVLRAALLDRTLEETYSFEELFILNALLTGQPARALPVIEARGLIHAATCDPSRGNLEFNATCVLAALGRNDEALALARALVRHGYGLRWRFNLDIAKTMAWTQAMHQNEWLGPLAQTPAYRAFVEEEVQPEQFPADDPAANALCALREDVWEGKKKKRCWLSKKLIAPGTPVIRVRRLVGLAKDGEYDIAAKEVFDRSGWVVPRQQFETDTIPLEVLFPEPRRLHHGCGWHSPAISAFHWDIGRNPASFDLGRAISIIADHRPRKIPREWIRGKYDYAPAFERMVCAQGHGDAVNFTWRLLKAGFGPALFEEAADLPQAMADKVFAMLAMFEREDCQRAAASHFRLPDLPETIELAFSERPSLDTHLALAGFADRHPRWRAALADAMDAYALHLYSNYHPEVNWFLQGLEHFSLARCCQLLFFFIHHPEDDEVLATMIEKEWLPAGVGTGAYDAYSNACSFYYRAAVLNRMLHAPERLEFWLQSDWMNHGGSRDRETRRLVDQWPNANPRKPERREKHN